MIIVWDTETTGFPLWGSPSEHPDQPHICSIAWIPCTDNAEPMTQEPIYRLIKPEPYYSVMPAEAFGVHGLTIERLQDEGVELAEVMDEFMTGVGECAYDVAFNRAFDARMIRIAQHRLLHPGDLLDWWQARPGKCAMRPMVKVVGLPATESMKQYKGLAKRNKTPTLTEVHQHLFGVPHENAHGAAGDAEAARRIWQVHLSGGTARFI